MLSPKYTAILQQAIQLNQAGEHLAAETACRQVLDANRHDLNAMHLMGLILCARNDFDAAVTYLQKCIAQHPEIAEWHYDLAQARSHQDRKSEALSELNKAIKLKPSFTLAVSAKADILEQRGDGEEAWKLLAPLFEAGTEDAGMAVVLMRMLEKQGRDTDAIKIAQKHLAQPASSPQSRRLLNRQLGRLYDRLGEYDKAFEAFGNAHKSARGFSAEKYGFDIERMIQVFSADAMRRLPRAENASELPVFIACMPRSGSTLVEQVIHAHPKAFGAGEINNLHVMIRDLAATIGSPKGYPECVTELTQAHLNQLIGTYLREIAKLDRSATRIVNKNLHNYKHLGMISLLFPKARVIHIQRNVLDNCLSMHMAALSPNEYPWLGNLNDMAVVWRQYEKLMEHWRRVIPVPMLEIQYEALVDEPEVHMRRIIAFCGLQWDDQCLKYYEVDRKVKTLSAKQVRKPIYKSAVRRWERYEECLQPLRTALLQQGVAVF